MVKIQCSLKEIMFSDIRDLDYDSTVYRQVVNWLQYLQGLHSYNAYTASLHIGLGLKHYITCKYTSHNNIVVIKEIDTSMNRK